MLLLQKRRMADANLAAHRRNARLSRGPVTPEGLERRRTARVRHGFRSKAEETALRALGENPGDYLRLLHALRETLQAGDDAQDKLVSRLARAVWPIDWVERVLAACHPKRRRIPRSTWREGLRNPRCYSKYGQLAVKRAQCQFRYVIEYTLLGLQAPAHGREK